MHLALLTEGDPGQLSGGYLYHRRMALAASRHGARLNFVSIPRRRFPLGMSDARARLGELKLADAVLLDSIVAALMAPWLPALTRTRPVIAVIHQQPGGADYSPLRSAIQARLDMLAYRRVAALIPASEFIAERLRGARLEARRITVVRPGRDPAEGQPPVNPGDLRRGRTLAALCISNWTRNKGIHWLLEALGSLPDETATLHLVGDTESQPRYAEQLQRRIAQADLRHRVVTHGRLPTAAVAGLLGAGDALLHPSAHEAYGTVVAEAMSAGLPVIASRVDNVPYLVRDGTDGILIRTGDVAAMASALALLASEPERRLGMGRAAQQRAMTWPTWAESAERFFSEIRARLAGE
jgi:glycosyltransferase involved in cell wall biosynthesis